MAPKVPSVKLNNSLEMPILGFGTWKNEPKPGVSKQAVIDAIDAGYRHIDCALVYQNEKEVGEALKIKFDDGTIKREDIFITSKLWCVSHSAAEAAKAIAVTLKDLGLAYLDLYLIHWPMGFKENAGLFPKDDAGKLLYSDVDYLETWTAMEGMVKKGLVRSIGLSNFNKEQIQRVLSNCTIVPANHQIEIHPYLTNMEVIEFCRSKGISLTAYSPLGSPDRPWAKPEDPSLMEDPKIVKIAEKYKKSAAQILIKYQIQRGIICIPKSVTKSRIIQNSQVFDFELTDEDIQTITAFNVNGRACHLYWNSDHPLFPFKNECQ